MPNSQQHHLNLCKKMMEIVLIFYMKIHFFQSQFRQQTLENEIVCHLLSRQKKRRFLPVKEDRGKSRMLLFKLRFMSYYAHCPFNHIIFQGSNRSRQGRSGIMGKKSIFRRNRDKTPEPLQEYFSLCILNIYFIILSTFL